MEKVTFIRCNVCGNLFGVIHSSGVTPVCCEQPMEQLEPNTTDAAGEKHVPVIERNGDTVTVRIGTVEHPMQPEHFIQWIALSQGSRMQRVQLSPGEKPEAVFCADASSPVTAYEYCNLHGLWSAEG